LFAAVDPPPEAVADLERALASAAARSLRWAPPEQWHVTLAFYGEVKDLAVEDLTERLSRAAARSPTLSLQLASAGTFPRRPNAAKILWAGLQGDTGDLSRLADRCRAAGRHAGTPVDGRKFAPHLTLARANQPSNMSRALTALWSYSGPTWTAGTLRLVKSTLGPTVHHETIAEFALRVTNGPKSTHPSGQQRQNRTPAEQPTPAERRCVLFGTAPRG
jgi:RNA 2',3'-cyclic 3'-phosphodiesterase